MRPQPWRLIFGALLAAECTSLVGLPWSTPAGLSVAALLLWPPALVLALLIELSAAHRTSAAAAIHGWLGRHLRIGLGSALLLLAAWCALVSAAGYWAIYHVVDTPFGGRALASYAVVIALGSALVLSAARRLAAPPRPYVSWSGARWAGVGIALGFADGLVFPREQLEYHDPMLLLTLTAFLFMASRLPAAASRVARLVLSSALVLGGFFALGRLERGNWYAAIAGTRSSHQRTLRIARWLYDRDRDGFSAILGGGDCDDNDPKAYPLSPVRDCTGWTAHAPAASPAPLASVHRSKAAPKILVLVTIDAFRCGFAVDARNELSHQCPRVDALARQGWSREDVHTSYPSTPYAVTIMQTGDIHSNADHPNGKAIYLASVLSRAGYRTHAIATHWNVLRSAGVRASFDTVDESLEPLAGRPGGMTSELVTEKVLAAVDGNPSGSFVWAHYYDPHAPYVTEPGSLVEPFSLAAYETELRRTDAAIGRLTAALAQRPDAADIFVVITADHGEEFDEHQTSFHGASLYEPDVHVPLVAWSPGRDHRKFGSAALPTSTAQLAPYLLSAVSGTPFVPADFAIMQSDAFEDPQLGIYSNGWKLIYHLRLNFSELYNVRADPGELHDRVIDNPARAASMGQLMAGVWLASRPAAD